MADPVIEVGHLTKTYRLYRSPKDRLRELLSLSGKKYHHEFHALRDVSFAIDKGETVGIIGQNGSGKSTLLKIICGVLRPTKGSVKVNGRVSSLLELGAGFHPEFTGRDNVYMNGALVGLSRNEIDTRFPEIVAFADIGEFIDQPVKTYSSGMFVRLAFAAAVHVDPEILVVDEALGVGDTKFQRKCMRKMEELRSKDRTIIIVSHNLYTIRAFCSTSILLKQGHVVACGDPDEMVNLYQQDMNEQEAAARQKGGGSGHLFHLSGTDDIKVTGARLLNRDGKEATRFKTGDDVVLEVSYSAKGTIVRPTFGYSICTKGEKKLEDIRESMGIARHHEKIDRLRITSYSTKWAGCSPSHVIGDGTVKVHLKAIPLLPGNYSVVFAIRDEYDLIDYDRIEEIASFEICEGDDKTGILGSCGVVSWPAEWEFDDAGDGHQST